MKENTTRKLIITIVVVECTLVTRVAMESERSFFSPIHLRDLSFSLSIITSQELEHAHHITIPDHHPPREGHDGV
jgi:hypothetical protein